MRMRGMRRAAAWLAAALLAAAVCPAAAEKTESDEMPAAAVSTEAAAESTEAPEKTAVDISDKCMYNGYQGGPKHKLNDGVYNNVYETGMRNGARAVEITVTDGEPMGAVYIQWAKDPLPVAVEVPTDDGGWMVIATGDGEFFADYIPVPENRHCRIVCSFDPTMKLEISEMRVLTAGTPGPEIQVWQKPGKVDLMLIAGHPDDDLLWFGGALPYYAGELKKDTLVVCCAMSRDLRRLELCDALWACGVRIHPIYLHLRDFSDTDPKKFIQAWGGEERLNEIFTELYRRYKPDVVLLQDVNGEYGHGIHRAASLFGRQCVEMAADPGLFPDSAARFGTWEVPKVYVHLWEENQIRMDWKQPLEAFGGKTALEAAQDALQYHKSQVVHGWAVQDGGDLDNSLFGLWHTTVGPDIEKNDFFENIPSAKE